MTIPALNDSKLIGMCLYNVVILSGLGLTLSLLLEEREVLLYGVVSGGLLIGTTLTQLMMFVPKVNKPNTMLFLIIYGSYCNFEAKEIRQSPLFIMFGNAV